MFLFFTGSTYTTDIAAFNNMKKAADDVLSVERSNFNPVRIETQLPRWIRSENSNIKAFLQYYYDWIGSLYGYTGINLMDLSNLSNIEETPDFMLPNYISMYAPDIQGIYELPDHLRPSSENIRKTILNIKNEIYQRKSNEDAFKSLMASLFSIDPETIKISYPKRKIMRLNGGLMEWMSNAEYYGETGEYSEGRYTMVGSHLNQGVLPDGGMWQDYSYLITSEIDDSNPYYEAIVKETLHPAGIVGLYEKLEKYSEEGYVAPPPIDYEIPRISNYYPYTLGSFESLPRCSGCTGSLFVAGWTFPTFAYPSWDVEIANGSSANFGSIKIWDFLVLNSFPGQLSPNDSIGTSCSLACESTGGIDFIWEIGEDEAPSSVIFEETYQEEPFTKKDPLTYDLT